MVPGSLGRSTFTCNTFLLCFLFFIIIIYLFIYLSIYLFIYLFIYFFFLGGGGLGGGRWGGRKVLFLPGLWTGHWLRGGGAINVLCLDVCVGGLKSVY